MRGLRRWKVPRRRFAAATLAAAVIGVLLSAGLASYAATAVAGGSPSSPAQGQYPTTVPGFGCGDPNNVHTGPPTPQYAPPPTPRPQYVPPVPPPGCSKTP